MRSRALQQGRAASRARCPHRTRQLVGCFIKTMHTDRLDWLLPAHRRGTLSGMDAAPEPTRTYLRRVLRWWAGKGPAANSQRQERGALTAPDSWSAALSKTMHTAHLDWLLPAHHRRTRRKYVHQTIGRLLY
ncbi:hypothetical protein XarjCFBP7653_18660 [Xanthomonas arboricola]|nr:hypothetical protein XarjCFBP7653_18660 [Xanthomonas arboricola]